MSSATTTEPTKRTVPHEWAREAAYALMAPYCPDGSPSDIVVHAASMIISNFHDMDVGNREIADLKARITAGERGAG